MANYLPVLLGSVNAVPDDSALSDLPRGQVDYLSHEWREEDVWRSWRNMTRLKNEIANGVRLENASWRTWWKQRNGLKTVTPETLNWYVIASSLSSRQPNPLQAKGLRCHLALRASPHCRTARLYPKALPHYRCRFGPPLVPVLHPPQRHRQETHPEAPFNNRTPHLRLPTFPPLQSSRVG